MKTLSIKRALNDSTRKQGVWMRKPDGSIEVYSLHITKNVEAMITDNSDYEKIYCVMSLDYYNATY